MSSQSADVKSASVFSAFSHRSKVVEIVSICQIAAIFCVIFACIINLSIGDDKSVLWSSLLSGSLGYLLPAPKVKRNVRVLSDPTIKQQHEHVSDQHIGSISDALTYPDFVDGKLGGSVGGSEHATVVVHSTKDA